MVKLIPQIVKVPADLPEPVVIEHPDKLTQQDISQLPDAPSTLLPDPTVKLLIDQAADDLACQKSWAACQQNYADMKKERDAAVRRTQGKLSGSGPSISQLGSQSAAPSVTRRTVGSSTKYQVPSEG